MASIQECCAQHIARYKLPRRVFVVDSIKRSPSGKPDYQWAKQTALDLLQDLVE
jgi:fatty-acyl-CoA synthase